MPKNTVKISDETLDAKYTATGITHSEAMHKGKTVL